MGMVMDMDMDMDLDMGRGYRSVVYSQYYVFTQDPPHVMEHP